MPSRRTLQLVLLAGLLAGLSAYLSAVALGFASGEEGVVYPGDPGEAVVVPLPPRLSAEPPPAVVTVEIVPRGRLLVSGTGPCPRLRDFAGAAVPARGTFAAGALSVPLGRERAAGRQLARFELPSGEVLWAVVLVRPGAEEATVVLGAPARFAGRVAGPDGRPVAGASVWAGGVETTTDELGAFALQGLRIHQGLPLVVRAQGLADTFRLVDLDPAAAPPLYCLEAGCSLTVHLRAAAAGDGRGHACLLPAADAGDADSRVRHYPFFWAAIDPAFGKLDTGGSCRLEGLPRGARLAVAAWHPLAPSGPPVAVDLVAGSQSVLLRGLAGAAVDGALLAAGSAPRPGVLVLCSSGPAAALTLASGQLLTPDALLAGVPHARTAADGTFTLARPAGGQAHLALLPDHGIGLEQRVQGERRLRLDPIALPEAGEAESGPALRLRAERALRVQLVHGSSRDTAADVGPGAPLVLPLREPMLVDVTVRGEQGERRLVGLAALGVIEVSL